MMLNLMTLSLMTLTTQGASSQVPSSQETTKFLDRAPGRSLQSCTCLREAFPCYATDNGVLSCWQQSEDYCTNTLGGEYCTWEACTVAHCSSCSVDGTSCYTCEDGYVGATCESEESFFADVSVSLLRGGVVGMVSAKLHALLSAGFEGGSSRAVAVKLVAQAFTREYADLFELVIVLPAESLSGAVSHQEYFGAAGSFGTSTLQGVICGGNPLSGGFKAILHEITHNYVRPLAVVPQGYFTRGSHWGFSGTGTYKGMLGGFSSSAMSCASPAGRIPNSTLPCATNDLVVDATAGSPSTSNDMANQNFATVELFMMGLLSEAELVSADEELSTCTVPPADVAALVSYDNSASTYTVSCNGGVQFLSAAEQAASWTPTGKELAQGEQLRVGVVLLASDAQSFPASAAAFSASVDWATNYFENVVPSLFATASRNRATVNFAVGADEVRRPPITPPPPSPPPPPPPPDASDDGADGGAVAGGVIGGLVAIGVLAGAGVFCWRLRKRKQASTRDTSRVTNVKLDLERNANTASPKTEEII